MLAVPPHHTSTDKIEWWRLFHNVYIERLLWLKQRSIAPIWLHVSDPSVALADTRTVIYWVLLCDIQSILALELQKQRSWKCLKKHLLLTRPLNKQTVLLTSYVAASSHIEQQFDDSVRFQLRVELWEIRPKAMTETNSVWFQLKMRDSRSGAQMLGCEITFRGENWRGDDASIQHCVLFCLSIGCLHAVQPTLNCRERSSGWRRPISESLNLEKNDWFITSGSKMPHLIV